LLFSDSISFFCGLSALFQPQISQNIEVLKVQNEIEERFYLVLTLICTGMLRLMTASLGLRLGSNMLGFV
jgi:hypothetical protein